MEKKLTMPDNTPIERKSLEQFQDEFAKSFTCKYFDKIPFGTIDYFECKFHSLGLYHDQEISYYKTELDRKNIDIKSYKNSLACYAEETGFLKEKLIMRKNV